MSKSKDLIALIILILLIIITLFITYIKYFTVSKNNNIEEIPVNESRSIAIHKALNEITTNFNDKAREYKELNDVTLNATLNNYSIFISYVNDTTITYEFTYEDLFLNIVINNNEENLKKFNVVYKLLIESVQKRLNNQTNIDDSIESFLTSDINYDGLIKIKNDDIVKYQMDITKKIENGGFNDANTAH